MSRRLILPLALLVALASFVCAGSPADAIAASYRDCARQPEDAQRVTRYLWLPHDDDKVLEAWHHALAFHANTLSRVGTLTPPVPVAPGLWRIRIDAYGWKAETWEAMALDEPFFLIHEEREVEEWVNQWYGSYKVINGKRTWVRSHQKRERQKVKKRVDALAPWLPPKEAAGLAEMTGSKVPIVHAGWFLANTCRQVSLRNNDKTGYGYYDWLGLKNRQDFFDLIKLRVKDSEDAGREIRAAVEQSGVSQQGRQVVRLQAVTGGAWVTLDVKDPTGRGNPLRNLRRGKLLHDAEEWVAVLPNYYPVYLLSDREGKLQASAPDFIGGDTSPLCIGRDKRIHVGLSCNRCHGVNQDFLRPIDDWVRGTFQTPLSLGTKDFKEYLLIRQQYFSNLDRALKVDRLAYAEAVRDYHQQDSARVVTTYAELYNAYAEQPVTIAQACREMGVGEKELVDALDRYFPSRAGVLAVEIDDPAAPLAAYLRDPPGTLARLTWEDCYRHAQGIIKGYREVKK